MAVTKIIEVVGSSPESSDGAVKAALEREERELIKRLTDFPVVAAEAAERRARHDRRPE